MASFEELLNKPASEIERPKPLPVGTYHCIVEGPPELTEAKSGNKGLRFTFKVLSPQEDVDAQKAAEVQVVGKTIRDTYWLTEDALHRLVGLLENLGLDKNQGSVRELVAYAPGRALLVKVKHQMADDGSQIYTNVASTARV